MPIVSVQLSKWHCKLCTTMEEHLNTVLGIYMHTAL